MLDTSVFAAQVSLEFRRYNVTVPATQPKRQLPDPAPETHSRRSIHSLEATGILVIAILLLILTLVRYWRYIPWGAR
ncbi:MAG: hypothetical protein DMG84_15505 [Acidobacteria bacterium]|nr:MAG: hypothetical protein AUH15_07240 [Acidobacteriales bacterium 13_2_20CM_55_8]PYX14373.1 MAG: hypothetical protein DMG84_15505 [Acidobacteriota bacterium]